MVSGGHQEVQSKEQDLAPCFPEISGCSVLGQNELNSLYHLELQTIATVMHRKNYLCLKNSENSDK